MANSVERPFERLLSRLLQPVAKFRRIAIDIPHNEVGLQQGDNTTQQFRLMSDKG